MNHAESSNPTTGAGVLKLASLIEAATLAALVLIAVPLKHLAELPVATRAMGPVHGAAFLFYVWAVMRSASEGTWRPGEVARMIVVACIPLAGFFNQPWLDRKIRATRQESARE